MSEVLRISALVLAFIGFLWAVGLLHAH